MIIGFHKQFVPLIKSGEKINTIRLDNSGRWKAGRIMHMATDTRTPNQKTFAVKECISTQSIHIKWLTHNKGMANESHSVQVFMDGRDVTTEPNTVDDLVKNDGFKSRKDFFEWPSWYRQDYVGKIIHWTNKKY
jgi:uncharacterized protein YqfB (UPF0267 family)